MFPATLLLLPALLVQAPAPATMLEVSPGIFILKGVPTAETFAEIKRARITHVIDFRRDGEHGEETHVESADLRNVGASYLRYSISVTPPAADFSFIREILGGFPRGSRILIHCADGNRAAAGVCPWLVLDKGMGLEKALQVCRQAGMVRPETEASVRKYLASQGKS